MSEFRKLSDDFYASPQITPQEVSEAAAMGIALVINNRPDGEAPNQPAGADIEAATRAAGMDYLAIPIGTADTRESVGLAMAEKYGQLDRAVAMFRDYDRSVPVRLQSRLPQQPLASSSRTVRLSP